MNSAENSGDITGLLKAWRSGDSSAQDLLIPMVYQELRYLASRSRRRAKPSETLETTALVHEAYLRLVHIDGVNWRDRIHFFAVSAQLMRRILIDSARAQHAAKRGGEDASPQSPTNWDQIASSGAVHTDDVLAVDQALNKLNSLDPRRARIVELRVFGGLSVEEVAETLSVSGITVMRDWKVAKAWLSRELNGLAPVPDPSNANSYNRAK